MLEAGYDPTTAKNPSNLTKSKAWKQLLEEHLPDGKLLKTHSEALDATKWNDFTGEREPDHQTRIKAVDLGYKLKGKLRDNPIFAINEMKMEIIQDAEEIK
jgi:hypothetical protein